MTPLAQAAYVDWRIEKVNDRYWLTWCGWRQGSFPTLHDAVCEGQMRRRMDRKALR